MFTQNNWKMYYNDAYDDVIVDIFNCPKLPKYGSFLSIMYNE